MKTFDKVKYDNQYAKENYDRLNIQVPKGKKEIIQIFYKQNGYKSLNEYINSLINTDLEKNNFDYNSVESNS